MKWEGPVSTGSPSAAGSSRLWPPTGAKLPPTNATSAEAYSVASSPTESTSSTGVSSGNRGASSPLAMRLRRANLTPRRASNSATAANRSLCLGTNSKTAFGVDVSSAECASSSCSSSPACVLPAIQTGRAPARPKRSALPAGTTPASTPTSNFTLPTTRVRSAAAPIDLNRSASSADCAATTRFLLKRPANRPPKRRYRDTDLEESRALASKTGMPLRSHSRNRFGQSSVSMMIAARGRVRAKKRLTAAGVS